MRIWKRILRVVLQLLPFAYMAFIWYLSSQSSNSVVDLGLYDSIIKESLHLVEFAILYGLLVLAMLSRGELSPQGNRRAIFVAVFYALLDELHQSFIPSRSASVFDLVKDFTGIATLWYVLKKTYYNQENSLIGKGLKAITKELPGDPAGQRGK
ncbi:hypothetical protein Dred_2961 [Desulforamulus reducens MI-1]|uniref:VanZ-like domain-containing protein n=1 Tax=Desulforamulus reducens (strain ATCC BAA-1160 / DSM 100696 / MI-1) TaxID=349161 RepID=A4J8R1_DESRM|nr:VanZ family protein [Desulforamulus reducens]ABO51464.1 hypothetical protein Dred_2961 [Desulforamulus reducens MI-1]